MIFDCSWLALLTNLNLWVTSKKNLSARVYAMHFFTNNSQVSYMHYLLNYGDL